METVSNQEEVIKSFRDAFDESFSMFSSSFAIPQICKYYAYGCRNGESCKFSHISTAPPENSLNYFLCFAGSKCDLKVCYFAHRTGDLLTRFHEDTKNQYTKELPSVSQIEHILQSLGTKCRYCGKCGGTLTWQGYDLRPLSKLKETMDLARRIRPKAFKSLLQNPPSGHPEGMMVFLCLRCSPRRRSSTTVTCLNISLWKLLLVQSQRQAWILARMRKQELDQEKAK